MYTTFMRIEPFSSIRLDNYVIIISLLSLYLCNTISILYSVTFIIIILSPTNYLYINNEKTFISLVRINLNPLIRTFIKFQMKNGNYYIVLKIKYFSP